MGDYGGLGAAIYLFYGEGGADLVNVISVLLVWSFAQSYEYCLSIPSRVVEINSNLRSQSLREITIK